MFGLSAHESFILGIAALWVFSAAVSAMPEPTTASSPFYTWLYKFLRTVGGDLKSTFGQYIPQPLINTTEASSGGTANIQSAGSGLGQTKIVPVVAFLALLVLVPLMGCAHQVNAPLPKNAINSVDATTNAVLQSAHAAAAQYETDVKGGFVPSAALKAAVASLVTALNVADPLYQTWHTALATNAAAPEPAGLSDAVANVQSSLNTVNSSVK